ncbi:cytochrome b/b6 domain-containing protein [Thiolinea disciformis]|uniref:cytochrome b/b6 domain-containing protein n=1 Tax=Thiolinea disciformis TaxID=125614 RepID=UPI000374A2E7|nr:cytochrome b/b6 domain-containing protein [Thiolinea disciformis]
MAKGTDKVATYVPSHPVRIWDIPTRVFHWTLVLGIAFMWFSGEAENTSLWMPWHMRVGIFLLSLVIFRILWGFIGSDTNRFSQFVKPPIQALSHLGDLKTSGTAYHLGHNPLGAWMVLALLATILAQALTGLFASDDIMFEGPLFHLVSESTAGSITGLHHLFFNFILALALFHMAAIAFYRIKKRTNLVKAMLTGSADWPNTQPADPQASTIKFANPLLALVVFMVTYATINLLLRLI